jgi:enoyl-CoA hydratase
LASPCPGQPSKSAVSGSRLPIFSRATVLAEVFLPAGAVEAGFLDRVVEAAEFDQELATALAGIAQLDMTAHAATKLRVRKQALTAIHEAIQLETASYAA